MKFTFQINNYDRDGDIIEEGVFINVGDITTIKFTNIDDLEDFAKRILHSLPEIKENL